VVKIVDISASEAERKLNGDYPITAIESERNLEVVSVMLSLLTCVSSKELPNGARNNPDKYILPLDIVKRTGL
jgi:hypothetical protein